MANSNSWYNYRRRPVLTIPTRLSTGMASPMSKLWSWCTITWLKMRWTSNPGLLRISEKVAQIQRKTFTDFQKAWRNAAPDHMFGSLEGKKRDDLRGLHSIVGGKVILEVGQTFGPLTFQISLFRILLKGGRVGFKALKLWVKVCFVQVIVEQNPQLYTLVCKYFS